MNAKSQVTLTEIEGSQSAMRKSIAVTKKLSAQIDKLLKRYKDELAKGG